jgi:hypothetical protein
VCYKNRGVAGRITPRTLLYKIKKLPFDEAADSDQFPLSVFLFFFRHIHDFATFVISAIGANGMRQAHFATIRTLGYIGGGQKIVSSAAISACAGYFSLWKRRHVSILLVNAFRSNCPFSEQNNYMQSVLLRQPPNYF